ncbi:hypothetical protein [Streptacidiphilus carbonis]|uniref:hypothetical protein n=1 Tax=Streptacidiphilus carbonis TaxID=105422 RepID=UPI000A86ED17|nr:hypothetical protein [Streptacidiphilus carbonis]
MPSAGASGASPEIGSATSTPSPAPGHSASAGQSTAAGSSGAAGSSQTPSALKGPCPSPAACGFPDAGSTGPRVALSTHSGNLELHTDGQVISGWDLTGSLDIYANNVTVIDSRITSSNWWGVNLRAGYSGLRVLHSTVTGVPGKGPDNGGEDYAVSNMGGSPVEVGWNNIAVFGNAISMGQGDIHDNYVHDIAPFVNQSGEWQHADALISDGGNSGMLTIRHNTLLNPVDINHGASASIGLYADTGSVANSVVDGNWLAGGAYALYGGGAGANGIKVTNNVFSKQYHPNCGVYGAVAAWNAGGAGNIWSNNRMSDGTPVKPAS